MLQRIIDDFFRLSPETQVVVITQVVALVGAALKAFFSSKQASLLARAHEAVVVGIEHSDCEDCREAARAASTELGIEDKVKPIVKAIKAGLEK